ncbi:MAG: TolC family protein [Magnetococcales bacterium]|nr:TolC family protein [Magnetococcales bacterium]
MAKWKRNISVPLFGALVMAMPLASAARDAAPTGSLAIQPSLSSGDAKLLAASKQAIRKDDGLLRNAIRYMLKEHGQMKAARADVQAAKERIRETFGTNWFPQFDLTANAGYERLTKKDLHGDTELVPREVDLALTQRLFDFGQANANTDVVRATHQVMVDTLALTEQTLALEAVSAYHSLVGAIDVVEYARLTVEANAGIVGHQEALLEGEGGDKTDLLKAKKEVFLAQAQRTIANMQLKQAENRVRAIFQRPATEIILLQAPKLPNDLIPASVEEAVQIAYANHPQVRIAQATLDTMIATKKSVLASSFYPTILGYADAKYKKNVAGTVDFFAESSARVELTFPFNLGGTAFNSHKAATLDKRAAARRLDDSKTQVEKLVRDAWDALDGAKDVEKMQMDAVEILKEVLELAKSKAQEEAGDELLVLEASRELNTVQGLGASAKALTAVSLYKLLETMGRLNQAVFETP